MKKDSKILVREALLKRATGYDATETVEEFAEQDGEVKLIKRRVSTKNVPPDVAAAKLIMDEVSPSVEFMSDEQLVAERDRLLKLLKDGKYGK